MNTLIMPCGGKSSRFPNMKPKYMLTHPDGRLMIEHAMSGLNLDIFDRIVITIIKEHDEKHDAGLWLSQVFVNNDKVVICILDNFTKSASETIALTVEKMKIKGGVVIKDCDNFVNVDIPNPITNSITGYSLRSNPNITNVIGKSFLIANEQNIIQDIIEKKIVSETICIGVYAFTDIADFITSYSEILAKNVQSELFISHVISYMINRQDALFEVLFAADYSDWGTISEWKNIQRNMRTFFIDVDGVILKNSGKYGKVNWGNNTIMLKFNIEAIKKLQDKGGQIVITTSRTEEYRPALEKMLNDAGIKPYAIVMGLYHSTRVLVNDFAPTNPYPSAVAISFPRNENMEEYID
jgi:hypothetical protein